MTSKVTEEVQVALPLDVCAELGIGPPFGSLSVSKKVSSKPVKVLTAEDADSVPSLAELYTPERDAEEMVIQQAYSSDRATRFPEMTSKQ
jgi:hypothetical protein